MLDAYKKDGGKWDDYERKFVSLIEGRHIEDTLPRDVLGLDGACLLSSEDKPHDCHRRLVAEYLKTKWGDVEIAPL